MNQRLINPDGTPVAGPAEDIQERSFDIELDFNTVTGRGKVRFRMPNGQCFLLHPADARMLGMRLIAYSEEALNMATAMRMLMEIFDMSGVDALQLWESVGKGTRGDHAVEYERAVAERQKLTLLREAKTDGTTN